MVLEKHIKDFDSYMETMNNIEMAIKASTKKGDIDIVIKILKEFSIATNCLVDLLEITKGERITA